MKSKKIIKIFILVSTATSLIFFCVKALNSSYFKVEEVIINGNNRVSENEILKRSGIIEGTSTILFYEDAARKEILKSPWIKSVNILREYPEKVVIEVEEIEPFCIFTSEQGKYLYMSSDGNMLGPVSSTEGMDFPVINSEGSYNSALLLVSTELLKLSKHSNVLNWGEISEIIVSNKLGIRLITNDRRYIDFGTGSLVIKWHRMERIISKTRSINLKERYININSKKLAVVDFQI